MALKVLTRFPGGNATALEVLPGDPPEVCFTPDPQGSSEALWFSLRIEETKPDPAKHTKIKLTWNHADLIEGLTDLSVLLPVMRVPGQPWTRMKRGEESRTEDGQRRISWLLPHPAPSLEIALCFPFDGSDLDALIERSKGYWGRSTIGVSQGGRPVDRLHNSLGDFHANQPGLYLLARQRAGDTPGSWVLDGLLRHWAQIKRGGWVIWSVPWLDVDGTEWGVHGVGISSVPALVHAWGQPPRRHEARVIQHDLARWASKCKPALVLDIQAGTAGDSSGLYVENHGPLTPDEEKWANVLRIELKDEYAATDFVRVLDPLPAPAHDFATATRHSVDVSVLTLRVPFALCGGASLNLKNYRDIGQRIVQAVLRRRGKA